MLSHIAGVDYLKERFNKENKLMEQLGHGRGLLPTEVGWKAFAAIEVIRIKTVVCYPWVVFSRIADAQNMAKRIGLKPLPDEQHHYIDPNEE